MFFDPNEKVPSTYSLIQPGLYKIMATKSELLATSAGDGKRIATTFEIIAGDAKGRKLFHNFNYENKSEKAQNIGRSEMKRLCQALGVTTALQTPDDFHRAILNKPVSAYIDTRFSKYKDEDENFIKSFGDGVRDGAKAESRPYTPPTNQPTGTPPSMEDIPFMRKED